MLDTPINREYVRTDSWSVVAKVSKEDPPDRWVEVKVPNIAAGGLLFTSSAAYETGAVLWFDLQIDPIMPGITGKIKMKAKGEIRGNRGEKDGMCSYFVVFSEIRKNDRIRLDELIQRTSVKYKMDSESDI